MEKPVWWRTVAYAGSLHAGYGNGRIAMRAQIMREKLHEGFNDMMSRLRERGRIAWLEELRRSLRKAAADIFRYGGSKSRKYERVHFF